MADMSDPLFLLLDALPARIAAAMRDDPPAAAPAWTTAPDPYAVVPDAPAAAPAAPEADPADGGLLSSALDVGHAAGGPLAGLARKVEQGLRLARAVEGLAAAWQGGAEGDAPDALDVLQEAPPGPEPYGLAAAGWEPEERLPLAAMPAEPYGLAAAASSAPAAPAFGQPVPGASSGVPGAEVVELPAKDAADFAAPPAEEFRGSGHPAAGWDAQDDPLEAAASEAEDAGGLLGNEEAEGLADVMAGLKDELAKLTSKLGEAADLGLQGASAAAGMGQAEDLLGDFSDKTEKASEDSGMKQMEQLIEIFAMLG